MLFFSYSFRTIIGCLNCVPGLLLSSSVRISKTSRMSQSVTRTKDEHCRRFHINSSSNNKIKDLTDCCLLSTSVTDRDQQEKEAYLHRTFYHPKTIEEQHKIPALESIDSSLYLLSRQSVCDRGR